jgi:hypothetical protein
MQKVTAGDAWRRMLPGGQLWMPFFDELKRDEPVDIYMAPQLVTRAFKEPFNRLREDFVARLRAAQAGQQLPIAVAAPVGGHAAGAGAAFTPAPPRPLEAPVAGDVRIYIESNRHELNLWQPLGEQIRRRWARLTAAATTAAPAAAAALRLKARGLPVEQIDQFPCLDDADGVVLLWGRKTPDALVAQINKVENKMSPGRDAAPGVVAYLMPPQASADPVPAWGWQVLRFDARQQGEIDVVDDEDAELEQFLRRVLERRLQRDAAAAPPAAGAPR